MYQENSIYSLKLGINEMSKFTYPCTVIKNLSSSTTQKKLRAPLRPSLQDFKKILPSTFIYKPILVKLYMNANIMKTQILRFIKSMTSDISLIQNLIFLKFYIYDNNIKT